MRDRRAFPCLATVVGAIALLLFGACGGQIKFSTTPAPALKPAPVSQPGLASQPGTAPQPETASPPQMAAQKKYQRPVVRKKAYELFDMGAEGENRYKGKVVAITGMVDVNATKRPGPGGTSTLIVQAEPGEPPYAIATFGNDSQELLFCGDFQPPSVYLQGTYRGRDERGTVLLDDAKVNSVTMHVAAFDFRREDLRKPRKTLPAQNKTPAAVSAEQLAQGLQDDLSAVYGRYFGVPLQIDGVVAKQMQNNGAITMLQFAPAVTDKKTNQPVEFVVFCGLHKGVPAGAPDAAELAVGKRVRLLGTLSAAGNGQATIGSCVVQGQGTDK